MGETATNAETYLDPRNLAAVAGIDIRARMIVEGLMQGMHRSPQQGVSVEFAQHRPYTPGDDTRFLDWKVFGKTDKLYLKQYERETNLDLLVLCDISGSMSFSSSHIGESTVNTLPEFVAPHVSDPHRFVPSAWRKYDHAASIAAVMAYLALQQQDRVALWTFDQRQRGATRLSNANGHWRSIVEVLNASDPEVIADNNPVSLHEAWLSGRTNLGRLFDRAIAQLSHRSLIVVISDLFDDPDVLEKGLARLRHRRHDVLLLHTLDPAELMFPFRDPSEFLGMEAEGKLPIDPVALRKAYLEQLVDYLRRVENIARKFSFDYLIADTSRPLGPVLSHFLARRAAGIGKGR